jgi:hypothetical protein
MKVVSLSTYPQLTLSQVVQGILASGRITCADKTFLLRAATSEVLLSSEEFLLVRRVWERLQMGLVKVVD